MRYQARRVGDLGAVIAPPYDVISPEEQSVLYQRSPYNVVRLEYGQEEAGDDEDHNRYTRAAATLADWQREGILAPDPEPRFYLYQQEFERGGARYRRRSLLCRVRLEEWETGVIRPHERTLAAPKEDRLRLLQACRAQVSPIFALFRDEDGAVAARLAETAAAEPTVEASDASGQRHTLHLIADAAARASLSQLLVERTLYVADGHHRYETALAYREQRRSQRSTWTGDEPENFVMMALTPIDDPGLVALPIHRLVRVQPPFDLLQRLSRHFRIQPAAEHDLEGFMALLAEAGRQGTALGMYGASIGGLFLLTLADAQPDLVGLMPPDSPAAWRSLDVNVLQYGIMEPYLKITAEEIAGGDVVDYTEDAEEALGLVRVGRYPLVFLLNPARPEQVLAVADAGWLMPQKSTFFYPKLATGLVINRLDAM